MQSNINEGIQVDKYTITTGRGPEGGGILTITKGGVVVHQQTNVAGGFLCRAKLSRNGYEERRVHKAWD
jgi:hypothetical protein